MPSKFIANCFICLEPVYEKIEIKYDGKEPELVDPPEKEKGIKIKGLPGISHKRCKLDFFIQMNDSSHHKEDLTRMLDQL